jgi:hypothetical protein
MGRARHYRTRAAFGAAVALGAASVIAPVAAWADEPPAGDSIAVVDASSLTVDACDDRATEFTVLLAVSRESGGADGSAGVAFADASRVLVSIAAASPELSAALVDWEIELPSSWRDAGNASAEMLSTDTIAAVVRLDPQRAAGQGGIAFDFRGLDATQVPVTGTSSVTVAWTPVSCGPEPSVALSDENRSAGARDAAAESVPPLISRQPDPLFSATLPDTAAPAIVAPPTIVLEATGASGATADFAVTSRDRVDGILVPQCEPEPGSAFALGAHQVDCSVEDGAGNRSSTAFAVMVRDTTAPDLGVPDSIAIQAASPAGAPVEYAVVSADIADTDVDPVCAPPSGALFPLGTTTVTCTATDDAGNSSTGRFRVVVWAPSESADASRPLR